MTTNPHSKPWLFDPLSPLKYGVILADPPWDYENWSKAGEGKNAKAHYDCMPLEEIKAMPVGHLATDRCVLFLWATFPMLPQALQVMDAWGFRYVTGGAWHKKTVNGKDAFGTGYVLRSAAELFLIGATGKPAYRSKSERNLIEAGTRGHSRKPEETFAMIDRLWPDTFKVELFARQRRDGWDSWGEHVDLFPRAVA